MPSFLSKKMSYALSPQQMYCVHISFGTVNFSVIAILSLKVYHELTMFTSFLLSSLQRDYQSGKIEILTGRAYN